MELKVVKKVIPPRTSQVRSAGQDTLDQQIQDDAQLGGSCEFMGQAYKEGDKICHDGRQFVCNGGGWKPTGQNC